MFAEKLISLHDNKYTYASILCTSKDIKPILPGMLVLKCIDNESILSFSLELAEKTKSFIEANKNVDTIYICCDSGESQSAAIASFIRRLLGEDEQIIWGNPYLRPNPLVYQLLCEKYDIIISKSELKRYVRQNKNAFKMIGLDIL